MGKEVHGEPPRESSSTDPTTVFAWVGGLLLGAGLIFFIAYAFNQGWVSEQAQVGLGVLLGAAITYAGDALHSRAPVQGSLLTGAGLAATSGTLTTAYAWPSYQEALGLTASITSAAVFAIAAIALWLAHRQDAELLATEALIISFFAALSQGVASWVSWPTLIATAALVGGTTVLAHHRQWGLVNKANGVVLALIALAAGLSSSSPPSLAFTAVFGAVFLPNAFYQDLPYNGLFILISTYGLVLLHVDQYAAATLAAAVLSLALDRALSYAGRRNTPYFVTALVLFGAWAMLQFSTTVFIPVWSALSAGTAYVSSREDKPLLRAASWLGLIAIVGAFISTGSNVSQWPSRLAVIASLFFSSLVQGVKRRPDSRWFYVVGAVLSAAHATVHLDEAMLTLSWGGLGVVSLAVAQAADRLTPRYTGYAFLAASVVKLLLVDTRSYGPVVRIVSYLTLGAILLATSYVFQANDADEDD